MPKNLVIVESPAKAKTIENYLGKDFLVRSSYGHVRDLPKGDIAVDVEGGFVPTYEITKDKKDVIKELKKLAKAAEIVYLASDDDREGEAISWHLKEALDLTDANSRRIVFREITKSAILNAIESPRNIDLNLVNSQQARRILDRLVGYELSPILWRKIKTGLSAGRVQSVTVRLVVEREREIAAFQAVNSFKVNAYFNLENNAQLKAELPKKFTTEEEAMKFLEECVGSEFTIEDLIKKPAKKSPSAPFTTSTLQQEASRKLGYSVSQTMTLAQRLYEAGKITYMRTDSVNLSDEAMGKAEAAITDKYGAEFHKARKYKTKAKRAEEAHEAIRPTDFSVHTAGKESGEEKLYRLIWARTLASQMADALLEKTTAKIGISKSSEKFTAKGEVITFEGFLKVYQISKDEDEIADSEAAKMLPPLNIGQILDLDHIYSRETFSRPPARFTEATLVKQLEEMGIGRPSTYAPTISTVQKRGYVDKDTRDGVERKYKETIIKDDKITQKVETEITGAEKNKLFPTNVAMVVTNFLVDHFPTVTNYSFTADVEKQFDEISQGEREWSSVLSDFYKGFHEKVEITKNIDRQELNKNIELGDDPKTGKKIIARLGKFGPMVQLGENTETEKAKFASLRVGQFLETITLEDALELFKLPRTVGTFEEEDLIIAIGRFGPYVRHMGKFFSLKKGEDDPYTINDERAIELIKEKRIADANKLIKAFEENADIQVLNGRYGPYIKAGKKNVKIPKDKEPADLTLEECLELAAATPDKKPRRGAKKVVAKKAPAKPKKAAAKKTGAKKAVAKKPVAKKKA